MFYENNVYNLHLHVVNIKLTGKTVTFGKLIVESHRVGIGSTPSNTIIKLRILMRTNKSATCMVIMHGLI